MCSLQLPDSWMKPIPHSVNLELAELFKHSLNDNFSTLGFVIIGVFIFSGIGSMIVYRVKGFSTVCHRRHRLPINALSRNREASKSLLCFCSSTSVCAVHLLTAASTTNQTPPIGPRANSKLPIIGLIGPSKTSSISSLLLLSGQSLGRCEPSAPSGHQHRRARRLSTGHRAAQSRGGSEGELPASTGQYLNNVLEQDHRAIKRRIRASQHFRSFWGAWCTIAGYEAIHMIRKGQAYGSAPAAKGGLLHCFILGLFAATS